VVGAKDHSECKDCGIDPVTLKKKSTKTETATSEQECELVQFACEFGTDAPAQRPVSATVNVCEDCQAGYHGDGLGNRCILCAVGYYQDQVAQQDCKICTSDLCHMASGVTSDAILFQAGSPDSLPAEFEFALEKNNIDQNTSFASVNDNDKKEDENSWDFDTRPVYIVLSIVGATTVLLHRFFPTPFKNADFFFAGDHYIEDSVSVVSVLSFFFLTCVCQYLISGMYSSETEHFYIIFTSLFF
jgi:hypothetical protein